MADKLPKSDSLSVTILSFQHSVSRFTGAMKDAFPRKEIIQIVRHWQSDLNAQYLELVNYCLDA